MCPVRGDWFINQVRPHIRGIPRVNCGRFTSLIVAMYVVLRLPVVIYTVVLWSTTIFRVAVCASDVHVLRLTSSEAGLLNAVISDMNGQNGM